MVYTCPAHVAEANPSELWRHVFFWDLNVSLPSTKKQCQVQQLIQFNAYTLSTVNKRFVMVFIIVIRQ
jgi:hypothetical protein